MQGTNVLFGQIAVVFGIVIAGVWSATQWTAAALGYQLRLGSPWFDFFGTPVYHPWRLFEWWFFFDAYTPHVFDVGGAIRRQRPDRGGGCHRHVDLALAPVQAGHDLRVGSLGQRGGHLQGGLDQPAGVFLGQHRQQYLRHEGPEHVLTFAPTRSGKGVGLVVPTLLSWPASAVIHDIKGENWSITAGWRSRFSHCLLFNPTDAKSAAYNPLLEVRRGAHECDVQNIADILVDPEGALERRNHWEKTSHARWLGPSCTCSTQAKQDAARSRQLPQRPGLSLRADPASDDDHAAHRWWAASGGGIGSARSPEQIGQRAFRRVEHRHVIPRPVPRPHGGRSHLALRLAHCRPDRGRASVSLYLVVPPSDISRTKPLIRLILNQIGRRLTESLDGSDGIERRLAAADA